MPTEASSELRKRLQRVQAFTEGDHTPSDGRLGPSEITHELLLVAQDIISNGAPPVAGNSQLRLLAWLVADAMSADQPLDKKLALTVGKRLDRQCQKVRADMARVSADAEQARRNLQDAASLTQLRSAKPTDDEPEALPTRLASITASENEQLDKLRFEVYVEFWEIPR